jgi:hypothetical protein
MSKNTSEIIHDGIMKIAEDVHAQGDGEVDVPTFLFKFAAVLAVKVYESAPSIADATMLLETAIKDAEKIYLEKE